MGSLFHAETNEPVKTKIQVKHPGIAEVDLGFTKDSTDFLHTEHILLVDRLKKIRGIYNGTLQLEIEQLIKDIKELKRD